MQRATHSMTGAGFAAGTTEVGELRVEVRAVNGRGLAVKVRAPAALAGYEAAIEEAVRAQVRRGSLGVVIERASSGALLPDAAVLRAAADDLRRAAAELQLPAPDLGHVLQVAGLAARGEPSTSRPLPPGLAALLDRALADLLRHRAADGRGTVAAIEQDLAEFEGLRVAAAARAPGLVADHRERLLQRVREFVAQHLPAAPPALALVREVAIFADRVDVQEELQRLAAHLHEVRAVLARGGEVGRRLEFLLQELLRETNTLGSKSPDTTMAHAAVAMKSCIDRMKEQVANLE